MPRTRIPEEAEALDRVLLHRLEAASLAFAAILGALALTKPWAEAAASDVETILLGGADLAGAIGFVVVRLLIRRGRLQPRHANEATAALIAVLLVDSALHVTVLDKAAEAEVVSFVLLMVGAAAFLTRKRWFVTTLVGTIAIWATAAFLAGATLAAVAVDAGVHIATAAAFSSVLFSLQTRTSRRAERMRILAQDRAQRAEALADEVRASNRELEAFAYTASHDLRAPLRGINVHTQAIIEEAGPTLGSETRAHLDRIARESARLGGLVEDLLRLARTGQEALRIEKVDVSALAREAAEGLSRADPGRRVEVSVEPGLAADADPGLLRVVLQNLIGNAWKFTSARKDEASIAVGSARTPRGPAFYVRDNGIGFPQAEAENLFHPFRRLAGAVGYEGTGVGLTSVERIVRRHGGQVWAEAEPGQGATFWFTLGPTARELSSPR